MKAPSFLSLLRIGALAYLLMIVPSTGLAGPVTGDFVTTDPGADSGGTQDDVFFVHGGTAGVFSGGSTSGADWTQYYYLHNCVVSTTGTIYLLDSSPGSSAPSFTTIRTVNPTTGASTVISGYDWIHSVAVGSGQALLDYQNGQVGCEGMAWDPSTGTLLVCDPGNELATGGTAQLLRVNPTSGARSIVSGNGVGTGTAFVNITAVAVTPTGAIYVADCHGSAATIYSVNPTTGARTALAIPAAAWAGGTTATAEVHGMAWDPSNSTLLITDSGNFVAKKTQLIRVDPANPTAASTVTGISPNATTVGTGTAMVWAYSVFVSGSNKIYLTDSAGVNAKILLVDPTTGNRTAVNTAGTAGSLYFGGLGIVGTQSAATAVSSTSANGAFKAGALIPLTVTFSSAVTVTGTPTLALNSGGTASYASGSGGTTLTFNYTVGASDSATALDSASTTALALSGGTLSGPGDAFAALRAVPIASTANSLKSNKTLLIDTTPPTISIGAPSAGTITSQSGGTVTYLVTYADTNFSASTLAAGNVTLNASGSALASVAVSGSGLTRTVTLSSITGSGTLGITIAAGTATDTAGNGAPQATSSTFAVSKAAATVSLSGLSPTYTGLPLSASSTTSPAALTVTYTYNGSSTAPTAAGSYTVVGTISDNSYSGSNSGTMTIGKATLTVTGVTASPKTYDAGLTAAVSASGASLVGILHSDTVTLVSTGIAGAFLAKNVGNPLTVAVSGLTLGGSAAGNYNLTQPTASSSITQAPLTVTGVTANGKVYSADTVATINVGSAILAGVIGADSVSLNTASATAAFATKDAGPNKTVLTAGFTIGGTDHLNYALTQPTPQATISQAPLAVLNITANGKTYDSTFAASLNTATAVLSGILGTDQVSLSTASATGAFLTKTAGGPKTVTIAGLTISGTDHLNYSLTQPTASATISSAALTVTGVTAVDRVYDGSTTATVVTTAAALVGVYSGDDVTLVTTGASGSFATKAASGSPKTVTVVGLDTAGADRGNYALVQPTTTASISRKPLTISGVSAVSRVYDGTANATLSVVGATFVGVVPGDAVTFSSTGYVATFVDKTVNSAKPVTITGLSATGADASNYSITQPTALADITAAPLTVSGLTAVSRPYDGTRTATLSASGATLGGIISPDAVQLDSSAYTALFDTKDVATGKLVTVTSLALTGADHGNYSLTQPAPHADVMAVTLTVTADDKSRSFGQANPTFTASYSGFVGGESATVLSGSPSLTTSATPLSAAGPYSITAAAGSLTAAGGDYTFSFVSGTLTVTADPRASWRQANFGTVDNTGSAADGADPDGDGLVNLLEYALGSDPNTPTANALPVVGMVGTSGAHYLTLTIAKNPAASDVTYTVEGSSDLSSWSSSGISVTTNTTSVLVAQDTTVLGTAPRYLHLRVDPSTVTPSVGGIEFNLPGGAGSSAPAYSYVGSPFVAAPLWVSAATGVTSQTITVSSGWNGASFGSSAYVELLDGPLAGLTIDVSSQSATTLTLASASLSAYSPGMRFAVRSHVTLATSFGASSPPSLAASTSIAAADEVQPFSGPTQSLAHLYYKSGGLGGTGWRSNLSTAADQSGFVLDRSQGYGIARKSSGTRTLALIGEAQSASQILPIFSGTNLLTVTSPVSVTLGGLGLVTGDSTTGLVGDLSVTASDEIQRWTGSSWERLYYQTGGAGGTGWRSASDSVTDRGSQVFKPGDAITIVKKHGGEALYNRPSFP